VAGEITIRQFIRVAKNNLIYNPPQAQFTADMAGEFGQAPGAIVATYDGTDVDLSAFIDPGWVHIYNQEPNGGATASIGIADPETDRYYPLIKLAPGKHVIFELDELAGSEFYPDTGTGTGHGTNSLRVKAKDADTANVVINIFER
jgi:hypothetical protein